MLMLKINGYNDLFSDDEISKDNTIIKDNKIIKELKSYNKKNQRRNYAN